MELLRTVAMIMIIAYHIFIHCIHMQLTDLQSIADLKNGWFCNPCFSKRLCLLAVVSPMGQIGNAIFMLISGYFMAHKESIDLTKISKKLLLQLGFAAIVLGSVSIYAYKNITEFPLRLMPFSSFNDMSWFVGYYFIVVVIAKTFLNKFLSKLERKSYTMFIAALFALIQFGWSAGVISGLGTGLTTVCTGVFLYSLGGYVKKYNPFEKIRLWVVVAVIVAINFINIGNFYLNTASNILSYTPESGDTFIQSIPRYANNQFLPVVLGIAIFELFRRIKVPHNSVVNFIGASTFMVYLFHDNGFVYKIWGMQDWITPLYENVPLFLNTYVIWVLVTFAVGFIFYCIFVLGGKLLRWCKPLVMKK